MELHFRYEVLFFLLLFLLTVPTRCHLVDSVESVMLQKALKTKIVKRDCKVQKCV